MEKSFLTLSKEAVSKNTQSLSLKTNPLAINDNITIESLDTDHYPTGKKDKSGVEIVRSFDYYLVRSEKKGGALVKLPVAEALKIDGAFTKDPITGIVKFAEKFTVVTSTNRLIPGTDKVMYPLTLSKVYVAGENDFSAARVKELRDAIVETDDSKAIKNYTAVATA